MRAILLFILIFYGCVGSNYYPLDCKYNALVAAHAAEMLWNVRAYVATDHDHAQAFYYDQGGCVWLTYCNGCVVKDVEQEVGGELSVWTLERWDELLRIEVSEAVGM